MKNKPYLLVTLFMAFVTIANAQRYKIYNGIGMQGGITQFDIVTDNFETKSNQGYLIGLTASVDLPHRWYNLSYNIQLSENNIDISAAPSTNSTASEFVEYKMLTVQASFLGHLKLIKNYLTLDAGPMLQYNGALDLKEDSKEGYIITNYDNLLTEDISGISRFNINGTVGMSAGWRNFRLKAHYIYGFTNILNKLNDNDFNLNNADRFKGNQSMLVFSLLLTL